MQEWIDSLLECSLVLGTPVNDEAIQNMMGISRTEARDRECSADDLTRFLDAAVAIRRRQVEGDGRRPVTFYAWHDEQAAQLRFSVATCTPQTLPFGARVDLVPNARDIVERFVSSDDHIQWTELQGVAEAAADSGESTTVRVWAVALAV